MENESVIYRASSLGGCQKALVAQRLGYVPLAPPEKFLKIFAEGTALEETVYTLLYAEGYDVSDEQLETNFHVSNNIIVQGHIDGLVTREGRTRLLEIKTMNADSYAAFVNKRWNMGGLMERYKWQVSAYMNSLDDPHNPNCGIELMFVAYDKETGSLHWEIKETPFYDDSDIRRRILSVESAVSRSELPVCDVQQYPCPFYYLHDEAAREESDDEELDGFATAYLEARKRERIVKDEITALRSSIERSLGSSDRVDVPAARITRYTTKRTSLDKRAMEDDGIDFAKYERQSESTSIRVTAVQHDDSSGGSGRDGHDNE